MLVFLIWTIAILLVILGFGIYFYYKKVKQIKITEHITFINNSVLCFVLYLINKIFKKEFDAITNPFNSRVHLLNYGDYLSINKHFVLYRHEYTHLKQIKKYGRALFLFLYLLNSLRGYSKNRFEIEAYKMQDFSIEEIDNIFGK